MGVFHLCGGRGDGRRYTNRQGRRKIRRPVRSSLTHGGVSIRNVGDFVEIDCFTSLWMSQIKSKLLRLLDYSMKTLDIRLNPSAWTRARWAQKYEDKSTYSGHHNLHHGTRMEISRGVQFQQRNKTSSKILRHSVASQGSEFDRESLQFDDPLHAPHQA